VSGFQPHDAQRLADRSGLGIRGRELRVRVDGQLTFNATAQLINAACRLGICVCAWTVQTHIAKGRLARVLDDWCAPYSGCHLFYPSRRRSSAAFSLVVDALRYRARSAD